MRWVVNARRHKDVQYLHDNQEEADTKVILHAVDATSDDAVEIQVHSPDTDVFVLALRRYLGLCANVSLVSVGKSSYNQ